MFAPAGVTKSHAVPFAYSKLLVRKLPTFAVLVTYKLLETFTMFAVARLPKLTAPIAGNDVFPSLLKFQVHLSNS